MTVFLRPVSLPGSGHIFRHGEGDSGHCPPHDLVSRSAGSVPSDTDVTDPWPRLSTVTLWFSSDTDVTDLFPGSHGLRHGRMPLTIVMQAEAGSLTSDRGYDGTCQVT